MIEHLQEITSLYDNRLKKVTAKHRVVVAIDFGTTYSGYAYSFTDTPDTIQIMRKWEGEYIKNYIFAKLLLRLCHLSLLRFRFFCFVMRITTLFSCILEIFYLY